MPASTRLPTATSSGCSWSRRWSTSRTYWSSMSPSRVSTRSRWRQCAGLLRELAETGVTVLFSSHQLDLVEDLCEDVVIIDHGRVVLAGTLDALRSATPERVVDIRYHGPVRQWSGVVMSRSSTTPMVHSGSRSRVTPRFPHCSRG